MSPHHSRITAAGCLRMLAMLSAATGAAPAVALPFNAVVDGESQIVEVLNPTGPVVRVQTVASGSGTPGQLRYHSGDVIDMASGVGKGSNRFVADNGDELFGSFSVQLVAGTDPSLFGLVGEVTFSGGTGGFLGAGGSASFLGSGRFVSATLALTHFAFQGQVSAVPEASSLVLLGGGLASCCAWLRSRRGRPLGVTAPGWG